MGSYIHMFIVGTAERSEEFLTCFVDYLTVYLEEVKRVEVVEEDMVLQNDLKRNPLLVMDLLEHPNQLLVMALRKLKDQVTGTECLGQDHHLLGQDLLDQDLPGLDLRGHPDDHKDQDPKPLLNKDTVVQGQLNQLLVDMGDHHFLHNQVSWDDLQLLPHQTTE
jgi:hypothetical protein